MTVCIAAAAATRVNEHLPHAVRQRRHHVVNRVVLASWREQLERLGMAIFDAWVIRDVNTALRQLVDLWREGRREQHASEHV